MYYINVEKNVKIAVYDLNTCGDKTILLIHGWPLSEKVFEYQKELLINQNYRVLTLDLRGYGNSDVTACGYTYDQFAADIYYVVRTLHLTCFTLAGFSMGGAIVLRYMRLFQGYGVEKLCLLGAAAPSYTRRCGFEYGVTRDSVNQLIALACTDRAQLAENFSEMFLFSPSSRAIKNWFKDIALSASGVGTIQSACSLRDEDGRKDLDYVKIPTGIFHGMKDEIVPFELGEIQSKCIKCSVLFPFEKSGHGVFYDELDQFNKCFMNFLSDNCSI